MNVKEALTSAKSLIEQHWHQGDGTDGRGNYCLRVAVGLGCGAMTDYDGKVGFTKVDPDALPVVHAAHLDRVRVDTKAVALVTSCLPEPFDSIPVFNDHSETTRNDVLAVLDKAVSLC